MLKFHLILLIEFLKILRVMSVNDSEESEIFLSNVPYNILPLTMIDLGDSCQNPTKLDASISGGMKFLSGHTKFSAESQGQQVFLCGMEKGDSTGTNADEDRYCTYPKKFEYLDELYCSQEPKPVIRKLKIRTGEVALRDVTCGQKKSGKMYQVVYKICMTNNPIGKESSLSEFFNSKENIVKYRSLFEIYRFCYDKEHKTVEYVEHKIRSPALLKDPSLLLQKEREKTYSNALNTGSSFNLPRMLVKENFSRFGDADNPFSLQKLAPTDDFALALWRKPMFDLLNMARMRKELTELWDYINIKIRENAVKFNLEYYIQTASMPINVPRIEKNTSKQTESEEFTEAVKKKPRTDQIKNSQGEEHLIWIKKIYQISGKPQGFDNLPEVKAITILMVDNFTNVSSLQHAIDAECKKNLCENFFTKRFEYGNFVRCCSMVTDQALLETQVDDINFMKISGDLNIDFLKENDH